MRHFFQEENTIIIVIATIYKDFDINRIPLTFSDTKNEEGVSEMFQVCSVMSIFVRRNIENM